jgi:sodium/potassium-transporting ATPase subunit alpha
LESITVASSDSIHRLDAAAALQSLDSRVSGLTSSEASARGQEFGPNALARIRGRSAVAHFLAQFTHFFAVILWAAAGLAALAELARPGSGMATLAAAIVAVILVNGLFSFWQERRASQALEALQRLLPAVVRVRRDGITGDLPVTALVPGDVIALAEGDQVPADCRLIEAFDLRVDNATLTGESIPRGRDARPDLAPTHDTRAQQSNMVLAGTSIAAGEGLAVVIATGMRTEFGRIAHLTQMAPERTTPLQREIGRLSRLIALLSVLLGAALFVIGRALDLPFWDNFVFAIGLIVANVPEGLLPTLTLSMAMGAQRMAARRTLVRHLPAVEALGSATVICTDKTGTLTENRMRARRLEVGGESLEVSTAIAQSTFVARHRRLFEIAIHAESTRIQPDGQVLGDPMEVALVEMGRRALPSDVRERLDFLPFSAERMRVSSLHRDDEGFVIYAKGALQAILPRSTTVETHDGLVPFDDSWRHRVIEAESAMARDGLRVLALAYRHLPQRLERDRLEESLIFAGLVGLEDPPRAEVPAALEQCHQAGIKVVMVTGDHPETGHAIARAIGLVRSDTATVMTGDTLNDLSDAELRFLIDRPEVIFARTSAEQKLRIVRAFQQAGAIVAVTGDGVNDAPALKAADVGVAMGISGTDVSRHAADIVLLDDNFASIVAAIEEGRGVFDNIRKFTTYVLTSNVPELVPYLAFVLLRIPLPLTIIQVLAVDLGTDMVPALGLGAEPADAEVMFRPPRAKGDRLIDYGLLRRAYLLLGVVEAVAAMTAYGLVLEAGGWHWGDRLTASDPLYLRSTTACLTAIVIMQVANVFACRSETRHVVAKGILANRLLMAGVLIELLLIAGIDYTSLGHRVFGTATIGWTPWAVALPFAAALLVLDGLWKRHRGRAKQRISA